MGMDIFSTHPQRVPVMAHLWLAHDFVEVGLGTRRRRSS